MTVSSLSETARDKIRALKWDRIIEKHEGPESWTFELSHGDPEFMTIVNRSVLLPISRDRHPNVTILRCDVREDGNSLTIFLKDTTYCSGPKEETFCAGFMAVCDRVVGEEFFAAILYHEWFILDNGR